MTFLNSLLLYTATFDWQIHKFLLKASVRTLLVNKEIKGNLGYVFFFLLVNWNDLNSKSFTASCDSILLMSEDVCRRISCGDWDRGASKSEASILGGSRPHPWKYWGGKHIVLHPPPPPIISTTWKIHMYCKNRIKKHCQALQNH